jgi:hypothetical protein
MVRMVRTLRRDCLQALQEWPDKERHAADAAFMSSCRAADPSDARLLELYPPFVPMRIKVLEIADGWRRCASVCR